MLSPSCDLKPHAMHLMCKRQFLPAQRAWPIERGTRWLLAPSIVRARQDGTNQPS